MKDNQVRYEDELTFAEFVESMAVYVSWIKQHLVGLVICAALGAGAAAFWAYSQPEQYQAKLTFVLNDQNNPQISSAGGILSQLGIPISTGRYNVNRLLSTAQSQKIIESTLLSTQEVDGKTDLLANHFLATYELPEKWKDKYPESEVVFQTDEVTNIAQSFALKSLYNMLIGSNGNAGLVSTDYGKTDYVMELSTQTISEELSLAFTNQHYEEIHNHYLSLAMDHNQEIYNTISTKRDSIKSVLSVLIGKIASAQDRNSNSFRNTSKVTIAKMESESRALANSLAEAEKYVGQAAYALETTTPLIQKLDTPRPPLSPQRPSFIKYGLFGLILGVALYLLWRVWLAIYSKVS